MPIGGKPLNSVSEICHATPNCRTDVGTPLPTGRKDMGKRMVGKRSAMILMPNCSLSLADQKWRGYDEHKNTR